MAENQNVEYKESWRDEYLRWVCGFANASGGRIYIGIDDSGKVVGVKDIKKLLEDIPNKIKDTMGIIADVNRLEKDGKPYIEIVVNPSSYPVSYHGEYHYRSGSTKQQLKGTALTEFLVKKTGYRWDSVPVDNVTVEELDTESFEIFRKESVRTQRMTQKDIECSNGELLDKLGLISDGKLKRAAVLLFYRNPQRYFTGCYVKIGKFGEGSDLQYQDVVEGSLILMADRVVELIYLKYLKAAISYEKEKRVETYPFAREAVREAVYNALVHCKWEDGIPVQIRIEDKAMYISNSCVFPSDWTAESLMTTHSSRPYNPDIANTFFRAGYIEAWGRGVQKICEECGKIGAADPEYSVVGNDITVKLTAVIGQNKFNRSDDHLKVDLKRKIKITDALLKEIISILSGQPSITVQALSDQINLSYKTTQRAIEILKEKGAIERIGSRKTGTWIVKK